MNDEFRDDDLADALRARAGGAVSAGAAHAAVIARAGRIRRRRAATAGGGMFAVAAIGAFALVPGDDESVGTADRTAVTTSTLRSVAVTSTTAAGTTEDTTTDVSTTDVSTTDVTTSSVAGARSSSSSTSPSTSVASSSSDASSTSVASTSSTTPSTSSTDAPSQPEPFTRTYDSAGGSIVVSWDGSALSLGSVSPAAGFEPEVEDNRADRVRVRFRGDDDHRIEVRVDDGELEVRIE